MELDAGRPLRTRNTASCPSRRRTSGPGIEPLTAIAWPVLPFTENGKEAISSSIAASAESAAFAEPGISITPVAWPRAYDGEIQRAATIAPAPPRKRRRVVAIDLLISAKRESGYSGSFKVASASPD